MRTLTQCLQNSAPALEAHYQAIAVRSRQAIGPDGLALLAKHLKQSKDIFDDSKTLNITITLTEPINSS